MSGKGRVYPSLAERLWSRVDRTPGQGPKGDCWQWTGPANAKGYGQIGRGGGRGQRVDYIHRVAFELANGVAELPRFNNGECVVCHTCDNPRCANPAHLFLGDVGANVQDMIKKGRKHVLDQRGTANNSNKLTEAEVRAIAADPRVYTDIADDYSIVISHVCNIKHGRSWPHLPRQVLS